MASAGRETLASLISVDHVPFFSNDAFCLRLSPSRIHSEKNSIRHAHATHAFCARFHFHSPSLPHAKENTISPHPMLIRSAAMPAEKRHDSDMPAFATLDPLLSPVTPLTITPLSSLFLPLMAMMILLLLLLPFSDAMPLLSASSFYLLSRYCLILISARYSPCPPDAATLCCH